FYEAAERGVTNIRRLGMVMARTMFARGGGARKARGGAGGAEGVGGREGGGGGGGDGGGGGGGEGGGRGPAVGERGMGGAVGPAHSGGPRPKPSWRWGRRRCPPRPALGNRTPRPRRPRRRGSFERRAPWWSEFATDCRQRIAGRGSRSRRRSDPPK